MLKITVPILADIFVFSYPLFLAYWYISGIVQKKMWFKIESLAIFSSAIGGFLVNAVIHLLISKQRPELSIINKQQLLLSHLPTDPFPSDHACVSAAIACTTLLIAYQTKNPLLKVIWWFFAAASLTMGISRVGVAVHWPTDVLVGWGLGIGIGYIVVKVLHPILHHYVYLNVIAIEAWVMKKCGY
jgi:undecaprenyl-diphosphatase